MIRQLKKEDIDKLVEIVPDYIKETYPEEQFTTKDIRKFIEGVLILGNRDMIIDFDGDEITGFISFNVVNDSFNPKEMTVVEDGMYIKPEYRNGKIFFKLLNALEKIAEIIGAHRIMIGCPYNNKFEMYKKIYSRRGYELYECSFLKYL